MKTLQSLWSKPSRLVIGLMSGTSADGIDAVLTRISGCGLDTWLEQLSFLYSPFSREVRERFLVFAIMRRVRPVRGTGLYGEAANVSETERRTGDAAVWN